MKLTIRNPEKIVNHPLPGTAAVVYRVEELEDSYQFWCHIPGVTQTPPILELSRKQNGSWDPSYRWLTSVGRTVTAGWFGQLPNAVEEIGLILKGYGF
jgi:hypothetical protein